MDAERAQQLIVGDNVRLSQHVYRIAAIDTARGLITLDPNPDGPDAPGRQYHWTELE